MATRRLWKPNSERGMIRINYDPLVVLVPLVVVFWMAKAVCKRLSAPAVGCWRGRVGKLLTITTVCWLLGYITLVISYSFTSTHLDHIEPSIVCAAHAASRGAPLYHEVQSAERYSMLYGPTAYLMYGLAMRAAAPSFLVCKMVAAAAAVAALLFCWLSFRSVGSRRAALLFTGILAGVFLAHSPKTFWVRADPIILLCVCGALWAVATWRKVPAAVALALGLGIAVDAKVSAGAHFVPLALILGSRFGWRVVAPAAAGGILSAGVPFLIPEVSLSNWFQILRLAGRHGFGLAELNWAVQWAVVLFANLAAVWVATHNYRRGVSSRGGGDEKLFVGIGLSVAAAAFFASKIGSDPTQLLPTVPVLLWAVCKWWEEASGSGTRTAPTRPCWFGPWVAASVLTLVCLAAYQAYQVGSALLRQNPYSEAIHAELRWLMKVWSGASVSMGCGSNRTEFVSSHFATLVLAGQPYVLDPAAVMEFEKAGTPLSPATIEMIRQGQIPVWLIPRGEAPFSMLNPYPPHRPLFDELFRRAFTERYRKAGSSRFFDIYVLGER